MPELNQSNLEKISQQLTLITTHPVLRRESSIWRYMGSSFLRGIAFGLGSFIGATIVVSILVYFISQIQFFPVIGEWVTRISTFLDNYHATQN